MTPPIFVTFCHISSHFPMRGTSAMVPRMCGFLSVAKKFTHPCVAATTSPVRAARMNSHFRCAQVSAHPWHQRHTATAASLAGQCVSRTGLNSETDGTPACDFGSTRHGKPLFPHAFFHFHFLIFNSRPVHFLIRTVRSVLDAPHILYNLYRTCEAPWFAGLRFSSGWFLQQPPALAVPGARRKSPERESVATPYPYKVMARRTVRSNFNGLRGLRSHLRF